MPHIWGTARIRMLLGRWHAHVMIKGPIVTDDYTPIILFASERLTTRINRGRGARHVGGAAAADRSGPIARSSAVDSGYSRAAPIWAN